jgi:FMN phosphatase YigB (HAD superfamily)
MANNLPYKIIFFDLGGTLVTPNRQWIASAHQTLNQLKAAGLQLGIISNTGDLTRPELLAQLLPVNFSFNLFRDELIILSSEVKNEAHPKPSLEIFRLALKRAQTVSPGIPLFCGEDGVETLAAQRSGFHALRILPLPAQNPPSEISHLIETLQAVPL